MASRLKKENPDQGPNAPGSSSYKRKKDAKDKAASGRSEFAEPSGAENLYQIISSCVHCFCCVFLHSSHNWNTLFLGTSAVADAIAQKYNTTKSKVLDHVSIWEL